MNDEALTNGTPIPTPTPTPTPAPTPTPTPPPQNTTDDDKPLPQTTQKRFFQRSNSDGTTTIFDRASHYEIVYSEENGYIAYNENGQEVYHIYPSGVTSFTLEDGRNIITYNEIDYRDITNFQKVIDSEGNIYFINNRKIDTSFIHNPDGSITVYRYDIDGSYTEEKGGNTIFFDSEGKEYKHIYPDGKTSYKTEKHENFVTYPNGDFILYGVPTVRGTWEKDATGNFICHSENGDIIKRNGRGLLLELETSDGTTYTNDYATGRQTKTANGKSSYSMINHIEYDEESYDKILKTFVDIHNTYDTVLSDKKNKISTNLSNLPDSYDISNVKEVFGSIITNIQFVDSLKEITNYSLLSYQTCDEGLKDKLEVLIDSLFEDNESNLGRNFKEMLKGSVEDRDNDSILEYKADTNFNMLYLNVIPSDSFTDEDGNIWYFNKRGVLVGTQGDNLKLNFGGETFNVTYDSDGRMIIKDLNGNPLDIFGDYNIDSNQYGGNQCAFEAPNSLDLLNDMEIQALLEQYYPGASYEEKLAYLDSIANTGCGNTAFANLVFKKFEGREKDFYNTFGYSMYDIRMSNGSLTIDYNYEPVILDLFSNGHKRNNIRDATRSAKGTSIFSRNEMEDYLKRKYGVSLDNLPNDYIYLGEEGYSLYSMDNTLYYGNGEGHAMIVTGYTESGDKIVSSWGQKYIFKGTSNIIEQLRSLPHKKVFTGRKDN